VQLLDPVTNTWNPRGVSQPHVLHPHLVSISALPRPPHASSHVQTRSLSTLHLWMRPPKSYQLVQKLTLFTRFWVARPTLLYLCLCVTSKLVGLVLVLERNLAWGFLAIGGSVVGFGGRGDGTGATEPNPTDLCAICCFPSQCPAIVEL